MQLYRDTAAQYGQELQLGERLALSFRIIGCARLYSPRFDQAL